MKRPRGSHRRLAVIALFAAAALALSGAAGADFGAGHDKLPPPSGLAVSATASTLTLSWTAVAGANSYTTYLDSKRVSTTSTTSWTFTALQCGTTHLLQVDAVDRWGRHSNPASINGTTSACSNAAPVVSSFTPTSGPAGTSVTITGSHFTGATAVAFNGTAAAFTFGNDTTVTATVPAAATTGAITVSTPSGTGKSSGPFTVTSTPPPAPVITSFTPTSGSAGTVVAISGSNFGGATSVKFNGTASAFTVVSASQISATVPSAATTGPIAVTTPGGTATSSTPFTVSSSPPPPPGNGNVFVAPPSSAGLGTSGSDSDATNCKRFSSPVAAPPGGNGAGCASFQKAYQLAQPGDTVLLNWSGAWATTQQIGPSNNKSSSKGCNYPADTSGCINFTPAPGLSPSLTPSSGGFQICADYVELSNLLFNGSTYVDSYGDTVSRATWWVGKGDSTCQPSGAPPHDVFIHNVVSNGPAGIGGGAFNVYVLGGSIGNSYNLPAQFGGTGNNGQTVGVNHSTIDGVTFANFIATDLNHHHMECIHMDYSGDSNVVRNSKFDGCPVYSIRVEAEGDPSKHQNTQTNHTFENNFFDGAPLNFDCHDNGCVLSGMTVRFNTFANGGFAPTNDCAQKAGNTCTDASNYLYGNLVNNGCASNNVIYGLGWASLYNVYAGNGGSSTICASDTTSKFGATLSLRSPGAPNYDDHLATCVQTSANLVSPANVPGEPVTDIDRSSRPKSLQLDAGANEAC